MGAAKAILEADQLVRRLAAVLAIDLVGYTRLMEQDEAGTHLAIRALRASLVDPAIVQNHGRIVKFTGDGFLAEFPDSLDAVMAAITIQRARAGAAARENALIFRIGVHVGDIIIEPDDIYGDGVNIAARLESFSPPGGVALSQAVYEQVRHNLAIAFDDMGELRLRNIARSLRAYGLQPARIAELPKEPFATETAEGRKGLAQVRRPVDFAQRLSIAVLPFDNMSSDPQQSYFADGIVEDIIGALTRFRNLFVLPRNVSFIYKGHAVDLRHVGRELNVRYVVEGSVRRAGDRVRITAQLIDSSTGAHLWADYFDGVMADIFALQNRVTQRIVTSIEPRVRAAEIERAKRKPTENLDAYDYYLRALALRNEMSYAAAREAQRLFERSLELDSRNASVQANLAICITVIRDRGWPVSEAECAHAVDLSHRAIGLEPDNPEVLANAAHCFACLSGDHDLALELMGRAIEINPNHSVTWARASMVHVYAGKYEKALFLASKARAQMLSRDMEFVALATEGHASFFLGQYETALERADEIMSHYDQPELAFRLKIISLVKLNLGEQARACAMSLLEKYPEFRISVWLSRTPFSNLEQRRVMSECLRVAGVPD